MNTTILLLILIALCLLVGTAGCIVPVIPGPPIAFIGIILLQCTPYTISWTWFVILALLAVTVTILDFIIPGLGTKKFGGSHKGSIGCFIGTIAGLFILPPWGIIIMPFVGALLGEWLNHTPPTGMIKAALGALIGFLAGVTAKFAVCVAYTITVIIAVFR